MKNFFYPIFLLVLLGSIFLSSSSSLAQVGIPQVGDSIALTVYPNQPGPNQRFEVQAESFSVNLDTIKITWVVNGKVVASGVGVKSITATTGALGTNTSVLMSAATPVGDISKTISIQSASIHLSWEGITYVPSFYKGMPLPVSEGAVKITAFPDITKGGVKISDSTLVYTWKVNGNVISDASGYGKSSFTYVYPKISRPATIEVSATPSDQAIAAVASVTISPNDPKIVIYEENPILGLLTNRAIGPSFLLTDEESRFVGVPYFFSAKKRSDPLMSYQWRVGGNAVLGSMDDPSAIVLRPEKGVSGNAEVSLEASQTNKILQGARTIFTIAFGPQRN